MGNASSTLTTADVDELSAVSGFSPKEIKLMHKRFCKLDRSQKGTITAEDFKHIPDLSSNPFLVRVIAIFTESSGSIDFKKVVSALSCFRSREVTIDKLSYVFKVLDYDCDNLLSEDDLSRGFDSLSFGTLTTEQLVDIASNVVEEGRPVNPSALSFEEFVRLVRR
ncbi:hypothetical protein P9112_005779 [Eukaryota sp. TZLM1-RC]